ncbi:MAG: CvpA family protein [Candidatus Auribacterota bacterium]|jgi:membrane protein required for colicin V production|nr:CvpA family protein [Candidatus Auribacterota bacterium]
MQIPLNWIDVMVGVILIIFAIRGYRRGLSGEILQVVGLLASLLLAYHFFGYVGDVLQKSISMPEGIASILGYVGVFVLLYTFFYVIRVIVHKIMSVSFIAVIEKGGGILAGTMRGVCALSVLFVLIGMLRQPAITQYIFKESLTGKYILPLSLYMYDMLFPASEKSAQFDQSKYMINLYNDANLTAPPIKKKPASK